MARSYALPRYPPTMLLRNVCGLKFRAFLCHLALPSVVSSTHMTITTFHFHSTPTGKPKVMTLNAIDVAARYFVEDIAYQQETLRNLVRHGEDTTEAVRSIGILEHTHLVLRSLREQLADELAALD
jgi:hypothetical protein